MALGWGATLPFCAFTVPNQASFTLQEENRPAGGFSLRGSLVSALEDNGVPAGKVLEVPGASLLHSQ